MARAHFREVIQDQNGNVIAGATVWVYEEGTTTPLGKDMHSTDSGFGDVLTNPLTTSSLGVAEFYYDTPQDVDLLISKTGYATQTISRVAIGTGGLIGVPGATTQVPGDVADGGTSTTPATDTHKHGLPSFDTVAVASNPGDTMAAGVSPSFARGDHRHPRESFAAPVASAPGDTVQTGASPNVANASHRHAREATGLPAASGVGDAQSLGSGTAIALANHIHAREAFAAPSALTPNGAAVTGTAITVPHSDHVHATTALPYVLVRPAEVVILNSSAITQIWLQSIIGNSLNGRQITGIMVGTINSTLGSTSTLTVSLRIGGAEKVKIISPTLPTNFTNRALLVEFLVNIAADGTYSDMVLKMKIGPDNSADGGAYNGGISGVPLQTAAVNFSDQVVAIIGTSGSGEGDFTSTTPISMTAKLSAASVALAVDFQPCMLRVI